MALAEDFSDSGFADGARRAARALATFASQLGTSPRDDLGGSGEPAVPLCAPGRMGDERDSVAAGALTSATTSISATFSVSAEYRTQSRLQRVAPAVSDSTVNAGMLARWEFFSYIASEENAPLAPVVDLPSHRDAQPAAKTAESVDARIVRLPVMRALDA